MKTVALIAGLLSLALSSENSLWKKELTSTEIASLHAPVVFEQWAAAFSKQYPNTEEKMHRFGVWLENLKTIGEHNSGSHSFKMRLNQFGDLNGDEFELYVHGKQGSCLNDKYSNIAKVSTFAKTEKSSSVKVGANPTSVDWRTKGVVTPVKNQGSCGSCWSFSATGATESAWAISKGVLNSLSEQELVDCSDAEGNEGCNGGIMQDAFEYIIKNKGLCSESEYKYEGVDGTCKSSSCGTRYNAISSYKDVTKDNEADLETAVVQQPQSIAIEANQSAFQFYSSGIISGTCGTRTDHGVLAVGYGVSDNDEYWIVKNSWGDTWGEQGYCNICKNCDKNGNEGECGINTDPSYPIA